VAIIDGMGEEETQEEEEEKAYLVPATPMARADERTENDTKLIELAAVVRQAREAAERLDAARAPRRQTNDGSRVTDARYAILGGPGKKILKKWRKGKNKYRKDELKEAKSRLKDAKRRAKTDKKLDKLLRKGTEAEQRADDARATVEATQASLGADASAPWEKHRIQTLSPAASPAEDAPDAAEKYQLNHPAKVNVAGGTDAFYRLGSLGAVAAFHVQHADGGMTLKYHIRPQSIPKKSLFQPTGESRVVELVHLDPLKDGAASHFFELGGGDAPLQDQDDWSSAPVAKGLASQPGVSLHFDTRGANRQHSHLGSISLHYPAAHVSLYDRSAKLAAQTANFLASESMARGDTASRLEAHLGTLARDRKSTRLNSSHPSRTRMPSSA